MNCDTARIYCGAVADDELEVVPAGVLTHIWACHDCSIEVQWQRESQAAIAGALAQQPGAPILEFPTLAHRVPWWRRGAGLGAVAAAAAVLLVAGTLTLGHRAPVPAPRPAAEVAMGDAAHAYGRPLAFSSTDAAAISGWSAGRGMPIAVMTLPGAVPTGARVSTVEGHDVVTVVFTGAKGTTEVTVIPAAMSAGWPAMEAMKVDRTPVGLVHGASDSLIVVTPDDAALHTAMTALQAS